ncbi:MAG: hypothetical protein LBL94_01535 [Prevotellaceae bacterium]|jgi:hypothetical protein|nr:hypothetical protein [Prevotellaceae bacterium]
MSSINSSHGVHKVTGTVDVYTFKEGEMYIAYCPSMDISAYGLSEDDAKKSFSEVMEAHIAYCVQKKTLKKDLEAHGWKIAKGKKLEVQTPSVEQMLSSNEPLKDIVYNRDYQKVSRNVEIPELV